MAPAPHLGLGLPHRPRHGIRAIMARMATNTRRETHPPTEAEGPSRRTPEDTRISANLRAEAARAGMSHDGLAARAGMSVHALRRRLRGEVPLTAAEVYRLATALRVPATALLDYTPGLTTREVSK